MIDMTQTGKVGRFDVSLGTEPVFGRVIVWFTNSLGERFGAISLEAARKAPVVDLYRIVPECHRFRAEALCLGSSGG